MKFNRRGKSILRALLHRGRLLHGARFMNRGAARILMYHDFPNVKGLEDNLEAQCRHINQYYEVVSLSDIADFLRRGKALPGNAISITIDDGNRDFLLHGYPIFHANKIPVTVFLVSGFLDRKLWLWWDQIVYLVENSKKPSVVLSLYPGQNPVTYYLETDEQRQRSISTLTLGVKVLDAEARTTFFRTLCQSLEVELPDQPPLAMAPMTWDEVRQLSANGVDFGAHTVTHPVLSLVQDPAVLEHEILESKMRIETELGRPVKHFCYPYGRLGDFNEKSIEVLSRSGFETSSTAQHGLITHHTPPYQLTRLSVDPTTNEKYFQERLAGLHEG